MSEAFLEALECRVQLAAVSWTGGAGDGLWATPGNWNGGVVPAAADDVTVDVPGAPVIQFAGGRREVRSLTLRESLVISSGTLAMVGAASASVLGSSVTIQGGGLEVSGAGASATAQGGVVSGGSVLVGAGATLTLASNGTWNSGSVLTVGGQLSFASGTHVFAAGAIDGSGAIVFSGGAVTFNGSVPAISALVLSSAVTVSFNAAQSLASISMSSAGATLGGSGALSVAGTMTMSAGSLEGAGTITVGGAFTATSALDKFLYKNIVVQGDVSFGGGGAIWTTSGSSFESSASRTWMVADGTAIRGTGTLVNRGTMTWSASATVAANLTNVVGASLVVNGGTVAWSGALVSSGHVTVNSGAILQLAATGTYAAGSVLGGAGEVQFVAGTHVFGSGGFMPLGSVRFLGATVTIQNSVPAIGALVIEAGTVNFNGPAHTFSSLTIAAAGVVLAGDADVLISGSASISAGTLQSTGMMTIQGGLNMSGASDKTLGQSMVVQGLIAAGGAGRITTAAGRTIMAQGGFEYAATGNLQGSGTILVQSSMRFDALAGVRIVQPVISIAVGAVCTVDAPDVTFNSALINSGTITVNAGARLRMKGGTISASSRIDGAGTLSFAGGTQNFPAGTLAVTGVLTFDAGSTTINSVVPVLTAPVIAASTTVVFSGVAQSFASMQLLGSGAVLTANVPVSVSGDVTMDGGTLQGAGGMSVGGTLTLRGTAAKTLVTNVTVAGNVALSAGSLAISTGRTLTVQGSFNYTSSGDVTGEGALVAQGPFVKSGAGGARTVSPVFTNGGGVVVQTGTLTLASCTSYVSATNTLASGFFEVWDSGQFSITSATIRTLGAAARVKLVGAGSSMPPLNGLTTNRGVLELWEGRGLSLSPLGGVFTNLGTILKDGAGTGVVAGSFVLSNQGVVEVRGGTLNFAGAASSISQLSGSTLTGGTWRVRDGAGLGTVLSFPVGVSLLTIGAGARVDLWGMAPVFTAIMNVSNIAGTLSYADAAPVQVQPAGGQLQVSGVLLKTGAGACVIPSTLLVVNSGIVRVDGGDLTIQSDVVGGRIETVGTGRLVLEQDQTLHADLTNSGAVVLGNQTLTVAGSYVQTGELVTDVVTEVWMGGLVVTGTASLDGRLVVGSQTGFDPSYGNPLIGLKFVDAAEVSGVFAEISVPSTRVGAYSVRYLPRELQLIFNFADYNGDGGVDGSDIEQYFLYWEGGDLFADVNGDGGVDGNDMFLFFDWWERGGG